MFELVKNDCQTIAKPLPSFAEDRKLFFDPDPHFDHTIMMQKISIYHKVYDILSTILKPSCLRIEKNPGIWD
jgi:hypothetical protein